MKIPKLKPRRIQYGYLPHTKGRSIASDETMESPYRKNKRMASGILIAVPTDFTLPHGFQQVSLKQAMKHVGREVIHDAKIEWDGGLTIHRHPALQNQLADMGRRGGDSMGRRRSRSMR